MGFFQSLQEEDLGQEWLAEARSRADAMAFRDHAMRLDLPAVVAHLRKTFGTAALKREIARVGQAPRDPDQLLGLLALVETPKRARNLHTQAACNLIAKLGGFPRVRDTIIPLDKKEYKKGSTIRRLHSDASKFLKSRPLVVQAAVADTVSKRVHDWQASGRPYDAWERHNLLEMKKKYSRKA